MLDNDDHKVTTERSNRFLPKTTGKRKANDAIGTPNFEEGETQTTTPVKLGPVAHKQELAAVVPTTLEAHSNNKFEKNLLAGKKPKLYHIKFLPALKAWRESQEKAEHEQPETTEASCNNAVPTKAMDSEELSTEESETGTQGVT